MYPKNWPRCPVCGDFALDGKETCGRIECVTEIRGASARRDEPPPLRKPKPKNGDPN